MLTLNISLIAVSAALVIAAGFFGRRGRGACGLLRYISGGVAVVSLEGAAFAIFETLYYGFSDAVEGQSEGPVFLRCAFAFIAAAVVVTCVLVILAKTVPALKRHPAAAAVLPCAFAAVSMTALSVLSVYRGGEYETAPVIIPVAVYAAVFMAVYALFALVKTEKTAGKVAVGAAAVALITAVTLFLVSFIGVGLEIIEEYTVDWISAVIMAALAVLALFPPLTALGTLIADIARQFRTAPAQKSRLFEYNREKRHPSLKNK